MTVRLDTCAMNENCLHLSDGVRASVVLVTKMPVTFFVRLIDLVPIAMFGSGIQHILVCQPT